tara:strand:- start:5717 stop:7960 length:2244 start_codon:yes stop_codon:yes gene_type:complete
MATGLTEISDLPLQTLNEAGAPPKSRLKDVKAATELFENLKRGDEGSAVNRTRVQAMFDGAAPYSETALRSSGQAFRCNLNFGEAEKFLESAMSAYVDLINSVETLVRVETVFGDPKQRVEWNRIMSEEYSFQLRKWPRFNYEYLNLCNHFVGHGVGINYFEDERSWHWRSSGLGDILIPRQTRATEDALEVAAAKRQMSVNELYKFVENPEVASELGWDVKEVRKAITKATSESHSLDDWEKVQNEIKNNDLWSSAKAARVEVIHMWVKEFNGTVSHFITLPSGDNSNFLYKRLGRYNSINEAFTFFTYGIGTNGTFHSIRGLGYKVYSHIQVSNRIRSQAIDNAMLAGAPMIQPDDERALENFAFNYFGPFAILPPNMKYVDKASPNTSQTMMPVLQDLAQLVQERAGQYSVSGALGKGDRKSQFEVAAHLEEAAKLNVTALNLFYNPWDRFHIEVARRFFNPEYIPTDSGGDSVMEFRERCFLRGVPLEALAAMDLKKTRSVRAVGNGSQAKRAVSLQQLNELAGVFDSEGRHNLFRDQVAALVGHDAADRYIPARPDQRIPVDTKVAQLENEHLLEGRPIDVFPNEIHIVHLDIHVPTLEELFLAVEQGQMELVEAAVKAMSVFDHSMQHIENIQQDPMVADRVNEFNSRLQQVSELIINGQRQLAKMQREAQDSPEAGEGEEGAGEQPGADMEAQEKLIEHRLKLQMMQEKHEMEMMIKLQKAEQERQLSDAKSATNITNLL